MKRYYYMMIRYMLSFLIACLLAACILPGFPPTAAMSEPADVTVPRYYGTWQDEWRSSSITYVDIEPSPGFYPLTLSYTTPDTGNYLVIVCYSLSNSNTKYTTSVQVLMNSSQIFQQDFTPNSAIDYITSGFNRIFTMNEGSQYTFQIQLATNNAMATAKIRDASIIIMKITDFYAAESTTPLTVTAETYQTGLSLNIPPEASGDYLVMASTSVVSSIGSKDIYCNWTREAASQAEIVRQLPRATESRNWLMMRVMTFNSIAETLSLQFKVQSPNTVTVNSQRIIAVKLSGLGIDTKINESESPSSTTSTTYTTKSTLSITPSPTLKGDYLIMGFGMINGDSKKPNAATFTRMKIDDSFQVEKVSQPASKTDNIPYFAFKKYGVGNSSTVTFEYKSGNTDTTTTVQNVRLLAIKVNTLQSYQDEGSTQRSVFDATYPVAYIHGYGYQYQETATPPASMPYTIAYYDGGTLHDGVSGNLIYSQTVNSNPNRSIAGSITFADHPVSSYGTWHAVVFRDFTGDPAPATTYTPDAVNSIMETTFNVQQNAFFHAAPSISAVNLYAADRSTEVTGMTPQSEYAVKVTVSNSYTINDLSSVKVTLFYDDDGIYSSDDVPATGDPRTSAILTCTVGSTPAWTISPAADTTWSIVSENCIQPPLSDTTGDFWFHFKPGKVASTTYAPAHWHIYAETSNTGGTGSNHSDNHAMNWYGEINVVTPAIEFGTISLGSNFTDNVYTGVTITCISNGNYQQKIKSDSPWNGGGNNVFLNTAGTPSQSEFSLRADDTAAIENSILVTTGYAPFRTGTQTAESGLTENGYTVWLKLGESGYPVTTYSGNVYYGISQ